MNKFKIGDKIVKNDKNWVPNDFDSWGRGIGVGVIVEPPFELDEGEYDVRWPNGRCFEDESQLLEAPKPSPMETREWNYFFKKGDKVKFAPDLPDSYFVFNEDTFYDPLKKFKDCRDSIGVVVECRGDLHAFGQGTIYICDVDFDGVTDTILAMFLIKNDKDE